MVLLKRRYVLTSLLSLVACLAMTGCGKGEAQPIALDAPCSFEAQITKGEQSFEVSFQRGDNGGWTAVFVSPESLSDMTVKSFGESCQVDYQGLMLEMQSDSLPAGSVAAAVESCIDHAAKASSARYEKDGDCTLVQGETSCGPYELLVSGSGELISLDIGTEICAEFSAFEKLE